MFMVHVGKYIIHGSYGIYIPSILVGGRNWLLGGSILVYIGNKTVGNS